MGSKRKEPEPNAGGAPGSTEATPVKQTKKQKTAAAAAAAAAAGPGAGGEGGGDAAQAAKPKKSRPKKPKADAAAQPATGAAAAGAAGAAGPAGAAEAQEEQEAPEDLMSHDMMRNALRKKKLEDAEKMKCAHPYARCVGIVAGVKLVRAWGSASQRSRGGSLSHVTLPFSRCQGTLGAVHRRSKSAIREVLHVVARQEGGRGGTQHRVPLLPGATSTFSAVPLAGMHLLAFAGLTGPLRRVCAGDQGGSEHGQWTPRGYPPRHQCAPLPGSSLRHSLCPTNALLCCFEPSP